MKKEYKKIVLAYSGGLDTSVLITWLKENYSGARICAFEYCLRQGIRTDVSKPPE